MEYKIALEETDFFYVEREKNIILCKLKKLQRIL